MPMLYLDPVQSAFMHVLAILGLSLVLPLFISRERTSHRALLYLGVAVLALRYLWWRGTATLAPPGLTLDYVASLSFFIIEALTMIGALSASLILTRTRDRKAEAKAHLGWWQPDPEPRVAILIATYNEDLEVLERTISGARGLSHSNKQILVLDDGRRDWLRDYCAANSVRYLRREGNKGAKAGNLNNALGVLAADRTPPDFIAVLDADFVPHHGFISRTLALFHDHRVGLVQTPQHFFNADPIQHNLGLTRSFPDEQRFFFDHVQPARDAWGIAICCGTSSMIRWQALQEIGGFPTISVTEDFLLTQVLRGRDWRTIYLNEALTEGLAPEGLKEYITQRGRWGMGTLEIARSRFGPFGRAKLGLMGRWSILDSSFYWTTTFLFRLAALIFPMLYWFGNVTVLNAPLSEAIDYFGCYYVWTLMTFYLLFGNMLAPILNDVQQLVGAIPIVRGAFTGLLSGKPQSFKVTAKGGARDEVVVQWGLMWPFLVLFALTLGGLLIGIVSDRFAFADAGDGKIVILFWSFYNLVVLAVTIFTCIELPRREMHVGDAPERVIVQLGREIHRVWIVNLTTERARIRGFAYPAGAQGVLRLPEVGDVPCSAERETEDGVVLALQPDAEQRARLARRFYARRGVPGISQVRSAALAQDIIRRLGLRPK